MLELPTQPKVVGVKLLSSEEILSQSACAADEASDNVTFCLLLKQNKKQVGASGQ